jgi:hypothetical protein
MANQRRTGAASAETREITGMIPVGQVALDAGKTKWMKLSRGLAVAGLLLLLSASLQQVQQL